MDTSYHSDRKSAESEGWLDRLNRKPFSPKKTFDEVLTLSELRSSAIHEAGHVVAAFEYGVPFSEVWLYPDHHGCVVMGEQTIDDNQHGVLAVIGCAAQARDANQDIWPFLEGEMRRPSDDVDGDLEQLANLCGVTARPILREHLEPHLSRWYAEACLILEAHGPTVERIANTLLEKPVKNGRRTLTHKECQKLVD